MSKDNKLNIWPDISGYIPAIRPFKKDETRGKDVLLNFDYCHKVDSTGLNFLLTNVLRLILQSKNIYGWKCQLNIEKEKIETIKHLGFFKILTRYGRNGDLFWSDSGYINDTPIEYTDVYGVQRISYPLYVIPFEKFTRRRDALLEFKSRLYNIFQDISFEYYFSFAHFIAIINEFARNIADHTRSPCMLGLDIHKSQDRKFLTITFSICDLGPGIHMGLKNGYFANKARYKNVDFSETYRKALTTGFTSKPESGENRGIGMSIIINGAKNMGIKLYAFDANSGVVISEVDVNQLTHEEVRKRFFSYNKKVGFYYYGELTLRKKNESN